MEFIRICRANFGKRRKERYKLINPNEMQEGKADGYGCLLSK